MKVILFGSTGMLGRYVNLYLLQQGYHVICINRYDFDIESDEEWGILYEILKKQSITREDVIINCAGAIPQQGVYSRKFIRINTMFPQELNRWALLNKCSFIHITTDCVFSGNDGSYNEASKHDATDIYGITKSLGENIYMCIIRTSIIGEEISNKRSLLEWVRQQKNEEIDGYENVLWNGVSCLQLAKIIEHTIQKGDYWKGVRHFYSPEPVSKYTLCKIINDVYELNITIHKKQEPCKDMTLSSLYKFPEGLFIQPIEKQIQEQQGFSLGPATAVTAVTTVPVTAVTAVTVGTL